MKITFERKPDFQFRDFIIEKTSTCPLDSLSKCSESR